MKSVAHSFFWWPILDRDIENNASQCTQCQELSRHPVSEASHHWIDPIEGFERVHLDYAEFEGSQYLLVESYSKWMDVFACSTARTVDCVLAFTAAYGILKTLVSDNVPNSTPMPLSLVHRMVLNTNVRRRTNPHRIVKF